MLRLTSGGAILCLHGLSTQDVPSQSPPNVPLANFIRFVTSIRRVAKIVPLKQLLDQHRRKRRTAGLVALTFDDAYRSILLAEDFLQTESIPLSVFVTTAFAERGGAYWWDRVDDLHSNVSPDRWQAFEDRLGLPASFRAGQPPEYGPLRPLRQWILAEHAGRWPAHGEPLLKELESAAGFATAQRSMTMAELKEFARSALVDVGVHTLTHPVLPLLPDEEAFSEIADSWRRIREACPKALPVLAFPFGLYDERTVRIAREAGMEATLSVVRRTVAGYAMDTPLPRFCLTQQEKTWKLLMRVTGLGERLVPWRLAPREAYPVLPSATT